MDDSDTRRGRPSIHRDFERKHREAGLVGDPARHGASVAVLLGDLMLSWADEQFRSSGLPRTAEALRFLDLCKTEVVAGQYLDVLVQTRPSVGVDEAMRVVRYKSAKYTVERPLHLGAALAGADDTVIAALTDVALPLGEAFQLRDDVLGVFGDPGVTGKPAGDDLREGKRTVLVARAAELGTDADRELLAHSLGTTDGVDGAARPRGEDRRPGGSRGRHRPARASGRRGARRPAARRTRAAGAAAAHGNPSVALTIRAS